MNIDDLKYEIEDHLEKLPEEELKNVLVYLKQITSSSLEERQFSRNLGKILREDSELLKRLAHQ